MRRLAPTKNRATETVVGLDSPIVFFEQYAADPLQWMHVSRNLLTAASRLWMDVQRALKQLDRSIKSRKPNRHPELDGLRLRGPFCLLAGRGIENLLKGLIVSQILAQGKEPTDSGRLQINATTHDLVRLSNRAGVELSEIERDLLRRLSTFVVWGGRYPVALSETATGHSRAVRADDWEHIRAFAHRIEALILESSSRA